MAQRFTTEYSDTEDRIRISHQLASGEVVVTWLTHRLLDRLIAHFATTLQKQTQTSSEPALQQSFAQQSAAAELAQASAKQETPPVEPPVSAQEWLVMAVDVKQRADGFGLQFRGFDEKAQLQTVLSERQLRQWLNIIRSQYVRANWSLAKWPTWLQESATQEPTINPTSFVH